MTEKRPVLIMLVLIPLVLAYICLFWLRITQPVFTPETTFDDRSHEVYLLKDGLENGEDDSLSFPIRVTDDAPDITFMAFSMQPFTLQSDGKTVFEYSSRSSNQLTITTPLETPSGDVLTLALRGKGNLQAGHYFITSTSNAAEIVHNGRVVKILELGMLAALFFYGLSLYLSKRSEKYLLHFAVYTFLLFLSAALIYNPGFFTVSVAFFYSFRTFLVISTSLLTISICYELARVPLPTRLTPIFKLRVILAIGFICMLVSLATGNRFDFYLKIPFTLMTLVAAVNLCTKLRPDNVLLISFFLASMVIRANGNLLLPLDFAGSFYYAFYFTAPAADIPCLVAYMVCTNLLFAHKFSQAEELTISLNDKVRERTQELVEQQKQKHQLITNVFHDLRSPLFVIRGCSEMIQANTGNTHELSGIIHERSDFLTELTDDLFLIAKLESNKVIFAHDAVDIADIIEQAASAAEISAKSKDVTLRSSLLPSCVVVGDKLRFMQAFENLLSNAIRYTGDSTEVCISMDRDDETVTVHIADHGQGLTADEQSKIFKQYYRANRTSDKGSTGLGLSIVEGIVTQQRGRIEVSSKIGYGSTFSVTLPLLREEERKRS